MNQPRESTIPRVIRLSVALRTQQGRNCGPCVRNSGARRLGPGLGEQLLLDLGSLGRRVAGGGVEAGNEVAVAGAEDLDLAIAAAAGGELAVGADRDGVDPVAEAVDRLQRGPACRLPQLYDLVCPAH